MIDLITQLTKRKPVENDWEFNQGYASAIQQLTGILENKRIIIAEQDEVGLVLKLKIAKEIRFELPANATNDISIQEGIDALDDLRNQLRQQLEGEEEGESD